MDNRTGFLVQGNKLFGGDCVHQMTAPRHYVFGHVNDHQHTINRRATEAEEGLLSADAQVLLAVVGAFVVLAARQQGEAGGVPDGDPGDHLAEAGPRQVHGHPRRQPQPRQDGGRREGRDATSQVS